MPLLAYVFLENDAVVGRLPQLLDELTSFYLVQHPSVSFHNVLVRLHATVLQASCATKFSWALRDQ